jgi:hypothetical protein
VIILKKIISMDPVTVSALIAGGSAIAGGGISAASAGKANKRGEKLAHEQMDWNEQQWEKQRQHSIDMWNKVNSYNHPIEQMARLKSAGINPHMAYMKGTVNNTASPVASAGDVKGYDRHEAKNVLEGIDVFGNMIDFSNTILRNQGQVAQNEVLDQEAALKAVEVLNKTISAKQSALDYGISKELRSTTVDAAKQNLQRVFADVEKRRMENEVYSTTKQNVIKKAELDVINAAKSAEGKQLRNDIDRIRKNLYDKGIRDGDNIIWRVLVQSGLVDKFMKAW